MRASLTVSGMLRSAVVRDWISEDEGGRGEADVVGWGVGETASPFVAGTEGDGEVDVRELEAMMVVACRFAGFWEETETFRRRDLNFVRLSSRAALASCWLAVSADSCKTVQRVLLYSRKPQKPCPCSFLQHS